jgi:hypothetical protein
LLAIRQSSAVTLAKGIERSAQTVEVAPDQAARQGCDDLVHESRPS